MRRRNRRRVHRRRRIAWHRLRARRTVPTHNHTMTRGCSSNGMDISDPFRSRGITTPIMITHLRLWRRLRAISITTTHRIHHRHRGSTIHTMLMVANTPSGTRRLKMSLRNFLRLEGPGRRDEERRRRRIDTHRHRIRRHTTIRHEERRRRRWVHRECRRI